MLLCSCFPIKQVDVICCTVETNAGDDCQDAGPDAEAGRRRGRRLLMCEESTVGHTAYAALNSLGLGHLQLLVFF